MARAPNDGGKDGSRGIVTGETGLAHATSIVDHEGGNVVVTHVEFWKGKFC